MAAISVSDLCDHIGISENVRELIWSVTKVLLSQETDLLIGRHLDQLIMCSIYGVCRVHPGCVIQSQRKQHDLNQENSVKNNGNGHTVMFNEIIETYKDVNRNKQVSVGRTQLRTGITGAMRSNNVSWVFIEVPLNPEVSSRPKKVDIIEFYNKVFLNRMKVYILATKNI